MSRRIVALLVAVVVIAAGCTANPPGASPTSVTPTQAGASPSQAVDPAVQAVIDRGKLVIGQSNQQPYGWYETPGNLVGLDPDIARECQTRLGLPEIEFVEVAFDGLIPGVQSGRFDLAASGMAYRDERAEVAVPADPTYTARATILVPKGNPLNLHSVDDLVKAQGNIGGLTGALEYIMLQENPALADRVVGYDSSTAAYSDLAAGRLIAVADGEALMLVYLEKNPDAALELADPFPPFYSSGTVMYFQKGAEGLVTLWNSCIKELKEDGTLVKILEKYNYPADAISAVDAKPGD